MNGKKAILLIVGIVMLLFVGGAIMSASNSANKSFDEASGANNTQPQAQAPAPQRMEDKLLITNVTFKPETVSSMREVVGEIQNTDTKERSALLKATFYDKDKKILGTATGAVNDIGPNQTKTFSLITVDKVDGYADMKVQIDSAF